MTAHDALTKMKAIAEVEITPNNLKSVLHDLLIIARQWEPQPWTSALPTEPGWYLWKVEMLQPAAPLYGLYELGIEDGEMFLYQHQVSLREYVEEYRDTQWKGPLDLEAL